MMNIKLDRDYKVYARIGYKLTNEDPSPDIFGGEPPGVPETGFASLRLFEISLLLK